MKANTWHYINDGLVLFQHLTCYQLVTELKLAECRCSPDDSKETRRVVFELFLSANVGLRWGEKYTRPNSVQIKKMPPFLFEATCNA